MEASEGGAARARLWPSFDAARVVYEDTALLVVDKPVGVPSQSADPDSPDDLLHRLRLFLAEREGRPIYLGSHQRLDQDTSGVILFARDKVVNPALAQQFEGRSVEKSYVAAVRGWRGGGRTLRHHLAPARDGGVEVRDRPFPRSREAITHVRVIEARGDRQLLGLRIETGRTHQIRAQLAHVGAPVAGDRLYGGAPAPRLLLHAAALALAHPMTGAALRFEAVLPGAFARWIDGRDDVSVTDAAAFDEALLDAAERRWALGRAASEAKTKTTAFRWLNAEGDGVPGLAIDVYGEHLVVHVYSDAVDAARAEVLDRLHAFGFAGIYLKRRPRQANELGDTRTDAWAPAEPVRGASAPNPLLVYEGGIPFETRLGDGLSTGIFLDQRDNRRRVRELAEGKRMLNLFAYTGAFTVAAAMGGARETVTVDVARPALGWAERNVARVDPGGPHRFVRGDVFEVLERLARDGERFDLVIADPPTYSTTRTSRWKSGKDWEALAAAAMRVAAPRATLLFCSNDRRMGKDRFRKHVHEGARAAGRTIEKLRGMPVPRDFPPRVGEEGELTVAWVSLG